MPKNKDNNNIIDFSRYAGKETQKNARLSDADEKKSSESENILKAELFKRFPYIKLTKDNNGNYLRKELILEYAEKVSYIVTVLKDDKPQCSLYRYIVPQTKLIEFLNMIKSGDAMGVLADIEKYIPEDSA